MNNRLLFAMAVAGVGFFLLSRKAKAEPRMIYMPPSHIDTPESVTQVTPTEDDIAAVLKQSPWTIVDIYGPPSPPPGA